MAPLDLASLALLAMGPAVALAALAGRLRPGAPKAAALATTLISSVSLGYMAIDAWLHQHAAIGAAIGVDISICGLGFVALSARFGHRLSSGGGLTLLILMAVLPIITYFALLVRFQFNDKPQVSERAFVEEVQLHKDISARDREQRIFYMRQVPSIRVQMQRCACDLSAAVGRAAARTDRKQSKQQLIDLITFGQEQVWQETPGTDHFKFRQYLPDSRLVAEVEDQHRVKILRFTTLDPPYAIWSDPWGHYAFMGLNRYTDACDAAKIILHRVQSNNADAYWRSLLENAWFLLGVKPVSVQRPPFAKLEYSRNTIAKGRAAVSPLPFGRQ